MTSSAFTFDRYTFIDRLRREAGIDERTALAHAEALDGALRDAVATKADLAEAKDELKADLTAVEAALRVDIAEVRQGLQETKAEIAEVRSDIKDIDRRIDVLEAGVRTQIAETSASHLRWLVGTLTGLGVAIVGAVWFLLRTMPPT